MTCLLSASAEVRVSMLRAAFAMFVCGWWGVLYLSECYTFVTQ
jgi:hypothetical protein